MKFTIICDEKPKTCEECPFYQDALDPIEGKENQFNVTKNCFLGKNDKCPLTEVNTIWSDDVK